MAGAGADPASALQNVSGVDDEPLQPAAGEASRRGVTPPAPSWMLARADPRHVLRDLRAPSWTTGGVGRVSRKALGSGLPSDHERLSPGVSEVRGARVPACEKSGRGGAQLDHGLVRLDPA